MNLIEKLIRIDKEKYAEKETKKIKSKRLSKILGEDTDITIKAVSGRRLNDIYGTIVGKDGKREFSKNYDMNLMFCVNGVIEPNLKDAALMEYFGARTPKDLAEILFDSEASEIADEIAELSGYSEDSEEEVKNS